MPREVDRVASCIRICICYKDCTVGLKIDVPGFLVCPQSVWSFFFVVVSALAICCTLQVALWSKETLRFLNGR